MMFTSLDTEIYLCTLLHYTRVTSREGTVNLQPVIKLSIIYVLFDHLLK